MEENQKGIDGRLEKLAIITDALEDLFPSGQKVVIIELEKEEYKSVQKNFRDVDRNHKRFKIEISNVEFVFIQEGANFVDETPKKELEIKDSKIKNFFGRLFTGKISG